MKIDTFTRAVTIIPITVLSLFISANAKAVDTACEVTLSNGGTVDTRGFPTTPSNTVLNGRNDGATATCTVISAFSKANISYPNGLTINTDGTSLRIVDTDTRIFNGLTIDDNSKGTGLVRFSADEAIEITGIVKLQNNAKVQFDVYNNKSNSSRLNLKQAYFNIEAGSELLTEFKLDDPTGGFIQVGAITGSGDIQLSNIGKTSLSGKITINNGDGKDYVYDGDIYYDNQGRPDLIKEGSGTYTFNGDVKKLSGDRIGFTDGFNTIAIDGGALQTTSNAFAFGTTVLLQGGDLILNQSFDGDINNATFQGDNNIVKRGTGRVSLGGINSLFLGNINIEAGALALTRNAKIDGAFQVNINQNAIFDVSAGAATQTIRRITGGGLIVLGTNNLSNITSISPGDSIGILTVAGSGNVNLSGTLLNIELDPTKGAGDTAGVTHDQLRIGGSITAVPAPLIKLFDTQQGASPSAFLNGREFTVLTAASGLANIPAASIFEDTNSFHAFVGADPEATIISDTEIKVKFGIKTIQQVATATATTLLPSTNTSSNNTSGGGNTGSVGNTGNASLQYLQHVTGLSGNQAPTLAQLEQTPELQNITTASLSQAASNNNPEAYSSNLTLSLEYDDLISNIVMDHASGAGIGLQSIDGTHNRNGHFWMDAAYIDGGVAGKTNHTGDFDYNLTTIVVGSDLIHNENNTLGVFASIGTIEMDEHDHINQSNEGDIVHIGAYHQYRLASGIDINSMADISYGMYDTERQNLDPAGGYAGKSEADFNSVGATVGVKLSKVFAVNEAVAITPSLGMTYTKIQQDSIKEKKGGLAYNYKIDSADADAVVANIGLDTSYQFDNNETPMILDLRLRYEYDAYANSNSTHDIKASVAGQDKHTFVGQNRGENGFVVGVAMAGELTENTVIGGGYTYTNRSSGYESSVGANFTYLW
jgi:autotransporter-associated beta strand protein